MSVDEPVVAALLGPDEEPPPGLEDVSEDVTLHVCRTQDELDRAIVEADVAFVWDFRTELFAPAFPKAENLSWIHTGSAGVDAVLTEDVISSDVIVTNTKGIFDPGIAEWVLGVMLLFSKDLLTTLQLQRRNEWRHRESEMLQGKRLLVVGAGSIGRAIAKTATAAGMSVSGIARTEREDDADFGYVAPEDALHDHLPDADFVVIAAPLTPSTEGMFGPQEFKAMRRDARLVNIGRGPIVQEDALVDSLRSGEIAGAALDVFEEEPLPAGSPLWEMENVVVSPHCSGDFIGWKRAVVDLFRENLRRFRNEEGLLNVVDKQRAYTPGGAA